MPMLQGQGSIERLGALQAFEASEPKPTVDDRHPA